MRASLFFPFLIWGYLETLRQSTFYAFGWSNHGAAFALLSALAVWLAALHDGRKTVVRYLIIGLIIAAYAGSVRIFSWDLTVSLIAAFFNFLVFLITRFILEQKSFSEILAAGIFLMVVDVLVSGQGIMVLVILNFIFAVGIKGQVFMQEMERDPRVVSGWGRTGALWAAAGLLVTVITAAVVISIVPDRPRQDSFGLDLGMKWLAINRQASGSKINAYDLYWEKLQDFQLGGEIPFDNRPVMYVNSPFPAYWRGESSDYYTGEGWISTLEPQKLDARAINEGLPGGTGRTAVQEFRFAPGMKSEVVFYAGIPLEAEVSGGLLEKDEGDNLFVTSSELNRMYRVNSYFPEMPGKTQGQRPGPVPGNVLKLYLQLPQTLPGRVRNLAEQLTGKGETALEKAQIIEQYLRVNYPYTLVVTPLPEGRDAVDFFLFDQKEGYCTYHSTAMVVMLRSIGIPARWVKGFTAGRFIPDTGEYEVVMNDAHAWVEVYLAGSGWIPFDPTSSMMPAGEGMEAAVAAGEGKETSKGSGWPALAGALAAGVVVVLTYFFRSRQSGSKTVSGIEINDIYESYLQMAAKKNYAKKPAETPLEFAGRLMRKYPEAHQDIAALTNAYMKYKYSGKGLDDSEMEKIREVWGRLKDRLLTTP